MQRIPIIGGPHDGDVALFGDSYSMPAASAIPKTLVRKSINTLCKRKCQYSLVTVQSPFDEEWKGCYERVIYLYEGLNDPPTPEGWCIDDRDEEEEEGR